MVTNEVVPNGVVSNGAVSNGAVLNGVASNGILLILNFSGHNDSGVYHLSSAFGKHEQKTTIYHR